MDAPTSYEEYISNLDSKLNELERLTDKASSLDQRLDVLIRLQIEQLRLLKTSIFSQPNLLTGSSPYSVRKFDLSTARTSEEVQVAGNSIIAYTDGDLSGISVRLDSPISDAISLSEFNSVYQSLGFRKIYLTSNAQSNKYLNLLVLKGAPSGNALSQMLVNIASQNVGVYLQPEWSALQGNDKSLGGVGIADLNFGDEVTVTYTPDTNKTLYITVVGGVNYASAAANGNNNQMCNIGVFVGSTLSFGFGGNGGGVVPLNKPVVVPGGTEVIASCENRANHATKGGIFLLGYET